MRGRTARLGDVCEINPRMSRALQDDASVSFLAMSSVSEDGFILSEGERKAGEVKKGYTFFIRGDVLLAKITPCFENGKATRTSNLKHETGFGSTEFHVLRASDDVLPDYVFHTVWNPAFRHVGALNMTGSAGQKRVPADFIKQLKIPLPPLADQRRITAILDKADALRRKRKRAIELLDELKHSIFQAVFGPIDQWPIAPFHSCLNRPLRNGVSPSRAGRVAGRVLTLSAITSGAFRPDASKAAFFSSAPAPQQQVEKGQFFICRGNGNKELVGIGVVSPVSMAGTAFPDTIIAGDIDEAVVDVDYLQYVWNSRSTRTQIERGARTTNGTFKVNQTTLNEITLPIPPRENQQAFGEACRRIMRANEMHRSQVIELYSLSSSLQHRAFSGQL